MNKQLSNQNLLNACMGIRGDVDSVIHALAVGADINCQDEKGMTAVMYAARQGHLHIVKTLIERNAELEITNNNGNSALLIAMLEGHVEVVDILSEAGASFDFIEKKGEMILLGVIFEKHVDMIPILLREGVDPDKTVLRFDGGTFLPALIYAIRLGYIDLAKALVENGASLEVQDASGYTPLSLAKDIGFQDFVTYVETVAVPHLKTLKDKFNEVHWLGKKDKSVDDLRALYNSLNIGHKKHVKDVYVQTLNALMLRKSPKNIDGARKFRRRRQHKK